MTKPTISPLLEHRHRWMFPAWLALFYGSWAALVWTGGHLQEVLTHWPIALAMTGASGAHGGGGGGCTDTTGNPLDSQETSLAQHAAPVFLIVPVSCPVDILRIRVE